jgi:hypothetical protein
MSVVEKNLSGSALPLPAEIQDAIDEFNRPASKERAIRTATIAVLMEDLIEDVRKLMKDHKG